jgi:class 3 adenylate cyclase
VLNSKDVLEKTGLSRATLNNYISWGIVGKPQVLPPEPQDGAAPRIGYFPDDVLQRIADIQQLKSQGWSMTRIAEHFGAKPVLEADADDMPAVPTVTPEPGSARVPNPPAGELAAPFRSAGENFHGLPVLTEVAVLATDLQDSASRWCELPAEEYFELVNQVWLTVDPIFRRHQGTQGKHAADGMVCHFLPRPGSNHLWNALAAAHEMRQAIQRLSKEWQLRKGWTTELYMNTGIDEGQEWRGTLKSASQEFTMLAGTIDRAARISDFARSGSVWVTKNLIGKLSADEQQRLKYGVRCKTTEEQEILVPSIFANVEQLAGPTAARWERLAPIARLPITEIIDIAAIDRRADRTARQHQS